MNCSGCQKNLIPPYSGNLSFTGNHTLNVGTPSTISTIKCGFCGTTRVVSVEQLKAIGISIW